MFGCLASGFIDLPKLKSKRFNTESPEKAQSATEFKMNNIFNAYHNVVEQLITANQQFRKEIFNQDKEHYSPMEFARLLGTVKCDIGRMTGKTSYLAQQLENKNTLMVTLDTRRKRWVKTPHRNRLFTVSEVVRGKADNLLCDTVLIDDASLIAVMPLIYEKLATDYKKTFLLLG